MSTKEQLDEAVKRKEVTQQAIVWVKAAISIHIHSQHLKHPPTQLRNALNNLEVQLGGDQAILLRIQTLGAKPSR